MNTLNKRRRPEPNNPEIKKMLDEAKKEEVIPLHVQLPASLMKKLRLYAVEHDKSLREVVIDALEKMI